MKRDVPYRRRTQIAIGVLLLLAFTSIAYFLSWESRTAILSCGDCGNIRVIHVHTRWWRIESVGVADGHKFVVPPDHEHRWWQYDSRRWDALRTPIPSRRQSSGLRNGFASTSEYGECLFVFRRVGFQPTRVAPPLTIVSPSYQQITRMANFEI